MDIEIIADAIDSAGYAHPQNPRERPRPFSDADPSDREYAVRLARAVLDLMKSQKPVAWTIPGDDTADANGFIPTKIARESEFTKPLYAEPFADLEDSCTDCGEAINAVPNSGDKWRCDKCRPQY